MKNLACDLCLSCEYVEGIVVSKGTEHLSGWKEKAVFVVCVDVDASKINQKEIVANCDHDSIVVKTGNTSMVVPKREFPGGHWFCIIRLKPQEALDEAVSLCPGKVESYIQ